MVIPPLPRWLFAHYCNDKSHCTSPEAENFEMHLLTEFMQLRGTLTKHLVGMRVKIFKVTDTCCTTNCTLTTKTAIRVSELQQVTEKDGSHLRPAGYKNMANRCTACLHSVDCTNKKNQGIHFWRVFRSTRGSTRIPTYRAQPAWGCGAPPGYRGVASRGRFPLRTVT